MGTRETQRRAWREAVAQAAEALADETLGGWFTFKGKRSRWRRGDGMNRLDLALSAPKPWTRPAKADLGKWGANVRHFTPEHKAWVKRRGMWSSSKVDWRSLRRKRRAAQRRRR